jgi:hypothetical protein
MREESGGRLVVVVMGGVAVAGTRGRMSVLYCAEQVHCPHSPLWSCQHCLNWRGRVPYRGCDSDCHREWSHWSGGRNEQGAE